MAVVGYSHAAVLQAAIQLDRVKLLGDGVSWLGSGKTITDHALSMAAGADCRMFNVVTPNPVCASKTATATASSSVIVSTGPTPEEFPQPATPAASDMNHEEVAPAPGTDVVPE